jgi:membrane fusion protein (multidrug efflux system)
MKNWIYLPVLALILVFGLWCAWKSYGEGLPGENPGQSSESVPKPASEPSQTPREAQKPKALPTVGTEIIKSRGLAKTVELTGSVAATRLARMASPGEGPILNCKVREGDIVKRGEKVLSIGRNTAAQALVAASQAAFKEQEQELKRVRQLVDSGAIPGAQLDAARSKFESAKAQVAKARESAEDYSVEAPWDGIVSKVLVRDGDYVAPRTALVELFDPHSLVIRFSVPEVQTTEIRENMAVKAQLDAYPGKTFQGRVDRVYPELDARMRTRTVEAVLGDPVDLIPGMFARIEVLLQSVPEAVTVPSEAVIVTPKGERVAFVVENGKAVRRKVETGIEKEGRVQILKGVQSGEQVIVSGNEKLRDGAEVQVRGGAGQ